ncbi:MAG: Smr/MutS family protein, partial [Bacteroidales bacterium]|nr:Smr/MutS family protein [Bacteroidales bacterium]
EALAQVGQLVDEAIMCEAPQIRILHGKGNGILRVQIQQYLNSIPFIANVHDEDVRFGGAGITVAEFN